MFFHCVVQLVIVKVVATMTDSEVELGNIMILSFIVILKCHYNQNRREIFNIVISPT